MKLMTMYLSIIARVLWFYKDIFIQVLGFIHNIHSITNYFFAYNSNIEV